MLEFGPPLRKEYLPTMVSKKASGKETPNKEASAAEAPKPPAKPAMKPGLSQKPPPLHPREIFGKGGKHPTMQAKGRSFRHQGR